MRAVRIVVCLCLSLAVGPAWSETVRKVGSTPTGVPFTFLDPKTNTIEGMMVDVINEVAKDSGFKAEINGILFSALIPALTSSKIDIIAAAMTASEERKKVVDFTQEIYSYGEGLITPTKDTTEYKTFADMKGKRIGAQLGTRYLDAAKNSGVFAEVVTYDSLPDIVRDVQNGRLDMGIGDYPILAYQIAQGRFPAVRLDKAYQPSVIGGVSIAARKDSGDLIKSMDASITAMKADGRLAAILKKWGL